MNGNSFKGVASLDRLIHEPARLMIMTILYAVEEADFVYLQRECGLTQGNLSSHLGKLEEAGYITVSKTFKGKYPLTICKAARKGLVALQDYCDTMRFVTQKTNGPRLPVTGQICK